MATPVSFAGVFPILATPFDEGGNLDLEAFERLIRFMAQLGVDGVTILGVLGESNRLLDSERETLIAAAVKAAAGHLPVIVGASHAGTRATIGLCQMAHELGADALMVTPPVDSASNEKLIVEYFERVAEAAKLPIVLQDHPASTQVNMPVALLLRLVGQIQGIVCIKEEATPTPARIAALLKGMGQRQVPVLTGLGGLYGFFDLESGASGFNTGFAFPEVLLSIVSATRAGRLDEAFQLYTRFLPLIVFEQQPGVAIRKELLRMRGLLRSNQVRHPGLAITDATAAQVRRLLDRILPDTDITQPIRC